MITDVNVSLSRWPFRRLPGDETAALGARLQTAGVTEAWAGSFEGLFHKDLGGVNARLADACRHCQSCRLRPFGSVNPLLPDWREDLRRCQEVFQMPGIRLHPNYHGYTLADPLGAELLALAEQRRLIVQLVARIEDPRMQHPLMRVADVDLGPLPALLAARPALQVVLLNAWQLVRGDALSALVQSGRVHFDIATLEGVGGIAQRLASVPVERLLFGSHFPFFLLESALLKLPESALPASAEAAIRHGNAQRLLPAR